MKKIPTLFKRIYKNNRIVKITHDVEDGMEWVLNGNGIATVKIDGSCCAIINGEFYKRYDAKNGKKPPVGSIPCCNPDAITGHHPHWVKIDFTNPSDKWFVNAYNNTPCNELTDGTYEAIGVHFNGNKYGLSDDILERHGVKHIDVDRSFDGIKQILQKIILRASYFGMMANRSAKLNEQILASTGNKQIL